MKAVWGFSVFFASLLLWPASSKALPGQSGKELEQWINTHPQLETTLHAEAQSYLAAHLRDPDGRLIQVLITGSVFDPDYFVQHIKLEGKVEKVILQFKPAATLGRLSESEAWNALEAETESWLAQLYSWQELDRDFAQARTRPLLYSGQEFWSQERGVARYKMDSLERQTEWVGTSHFYSGRKYVYELSRPTLSAWVRCVIHAPENALREIEILKHNEALYRSVHPAG